MSQLATLEAALELAQANRNERVIRSLQDEINKLRAGAMAEQLEGIDPAQFRRIVTVLARQDSFSGDLARMVLAKLRR